jgi:hypothetical protein
MSLDKGRALVDHYRDTFQITWRLWEKRNKSFLLLLGVIGLANLLTHEGFLNGLFLELIGHFKTTGVSDRAALTLPYTTVQFIILILVFYFTVNLYQNAASVLRNYAYLGPVEKEIRAALGFSPGSVAFTRESDFYWGKRPLFFAPVKYFYILISRNNFVRFLLRSAQERSGVIQRSRRHRHCVSLRRRRGAAFRGDR